MQIPSLPLFFFFTITNISLTHASIHGFAPSPAPSSAPTTSFSPRPRDVIVWDGRTGSASTDYSLPAPSSLDPPSPAPGESNDDGGGVSASAGPAPAAREGMSGSADEDPGESISPAAARSESEIVRWCAVREETEDCLLLMSLLRQSISNYTWRCVSRDSTQECLDSIRKGEADIINLEAATAFTAFLNYSMKAIANEVYCNHAESYYAVAVVPRKSCETKRGLALMDFKGRKSCHGGYSMAAGWTYPISYIKKLMDSHQMKDIDVATSFFSKICAPLDSGLMEETCSGCVNENGSCQQNELYYGDAGAFRCLMEEAGDIAFVRGDTALLYSVEGPYNQSWSTKSVRDFMYLCPQGGCREINGYPGRCSFGKVPANMIMASNSVPNEKRLHILETLANESWIEAAYAAKISSTHLLSPSTQEFSKIKTLTRSYLGQSASISQSIQYPNTHKAESTASLSDAYCNSVHHSTLWVLLSAALLCLQS